MSEAEEKILDQKSLTSSRAFNRLFDQTLNNIIFDIKIDKKQKRMSETQILSLLYDKKRSTRARAAKSLTDGLNSEKRLITFIFNQILSDCKIINELRGYKNPIDSRNLSNEIKLQTVNGLIQACNDNNSIAQRYYKLKAKILKINDFKDYDRYAPFGSSQKKYSFAEAKKIVLDAFEDFSPEMSKVASLFFDNNWIDYGIRNGKGLEHLVTLVCHQFTLYTNEFYWKKFVML